MSDHTSRWRRWRADEPQARPPDAPSPDERRFLQGLHDIRRLLSGEWTWDVLVALHKQPLQYTKLLDTIQNQDNNTGWPGVKHRRLQDSPLNRTLHRLKEGELVTCTREQKFPYRTTYELSPAARELLSAATPLILWTEDNADLLSRVRERRKESVSE